MYRCHIRFYSSLNLVKMCEKKIIVEYFHVEHSSKLRVSRSVEQTSFSARTRLMRFEGGRELW
jgi:hypothetical protein